MQRFKRATNDGFNYVFEKALRAGDELIVKMPAVTANKRGINDIGWQCNGDVTVYGTLSSTPKTTELWTEIRDNDEVNKTTTALKIVNKGDACHIVIRAILN